MDPTKTNIHHINPKTYLFITTQNVFIYYNTKIPYHKPEKNKYE